MSKTSLPSSHEWSRLASMTSLSNYPSSSLLFEVACLWPAAISPFAMKTGREREKAEGEPGRRVGLDVGPEMNTAITSGRTGQAGDSRSGAINAEVVLKQFHDDLMRISPGRCLMKLAVRKKEI